MTWLSGYAKGKEQVGVNSDIRMCVESVILLVYSLHKCLFKY